MRLSCNRNSYAYTYTNSDSNFQSHGYCYSDGYSQANAYSQTAHNAEAAPDTAATPGRASTRMIGERTCFACWFRCRAEMNVPDTSRLA
jgi:hypothetical protein